MHKDGGVDVRLTEVSNWMVHRSEGVCWLKDHRVLENVFKRAMRQTHHSLGPHGDHLADKQLSQGGKTSLLVVDALWHTVNL